MVSSNTSNRKRSHHNKGQPARDSIPGVQKIKSSLRQARRLLAKDNLAADVRVETERRIKSLEADLAKAEHARKERTLATKYHKVKFFERQKISRKIKRAKRQLQLPDTSPELLSSLREELFSHRVDLNYVLHYPKTKKYISLFPPESSNAASGDSETDKQREELRQRIRTAMNNGEISSEPEENMDKETDIDWEEETSGADAHNRVKRIKTRPNKPQSVPGDTFFEAPDNEDDD